MLKAVDLSAHNGLMTAEQLRGVSLVIAKCTELGPGITYVDPDYEHNRKLADEIGALFMPYAFGHPSMSAARSWEWFADHAKLRPGDLYSCDLEVSDQLTTAEVAAWGSAYAHTGFGATSRWPVMYSDQAFIELGNFDGVKMCPLWVAVLGLAPTPLAPKLPGFRPALIEQYAFGSSTTPNLDAVYLESTDELRAYAVPSFSLLARAAERNVLVAQRSLTRVEHLLAAMGRLHRD